jgi:hypothetical protein
LDAQTLERIAAGASYRVVVNSVPKSFKPDGPHAAQELYAHNCTTISDPSVIKEVRWLTPKAL